MTELLKTRLLFLFTGCGWSVNQGVWQTFYGTVTHQLHRLRIVYFGTNADHFHFWIFQVRLALTHVKPKCDQSNKRHRTVFSCGTVCYPEQVGSNLSRPVKPKCVTIQMKAIEQYFHVVLFIMLYKVVLTLSLWMKPKRMTIQTKVIERFVQVSNVEVCD